ncbi:MAG: hypothetical protein HY717_21025 [Planctomycetes bacterium]|nr:hypothetical protein [Planctomycetota bacterium]
MDLITLSAGLIAGLVVTLVLGHLGLGPGPAFALLLVVGAWQAPFPIGQDLLLLALLPYLYYSGFLLGRGWREEGLLRDCFWGLLLTGAKVFFAGGLAHAAAAWLSSLEMGFPPPSPLAGLWVGLFLSIPDPFHRLMPPEPRPPLESGLRPAALWGLFFALLFCSAGLPGLWGQAEPFSLDRAFSALGGLVGSAGAGLAAGLAGALLSRLVSGDRIRLSSHLFTVLGALLLTRALRQDPLPALMAAGLVHAALGRPPADHGGKAERAGWELILLVSGLFLALAAGAQAPEMLQRGSWIQALLLTIWIWIVQALLVLSLSGFPALRPPGLRSLRQLLLISWGSYPGILAAAVLAVLASRGGWPGEDGSLSKEAAALILQAAALSLLIQGSLAGWLAARASPLSGAAWRIWEGLEGRWIAWSAFRQALVSMEQGKRISETTASSLRRAADAALQELDLDRQALLGKNPALEKARWLCAVKTAAAAAREAIARSRQDGWISAEVEEEMEREFARWEKSGASGLEELFKHGR